MKHVPRITQPTRRAKILLITLTVVLILHLFGYYPRLLLTQESSRFDIYDLPLEDLWAILKTEANSTCSFEHYDILYQKRTSDKYQGECTPTHTWFDSQLQVIRMKCFKNSHFPFVYNSTTFIPEWVDDRLWVLFPEDLYTANKPLSVKGMEVIHTACVDLENRVSYHSFFTQVVRDEQLVSRQREALRSYTNSFRNDSNSVRSKPLDIHVIVLDSTGRDFFHRHFAHTKQYLDELRKTKDVSVVEMEQYQVLAKNSPPNMFQFSTGMDIELNLTDGGSYEQFLWKTEGRLLGGPVTVPLLWDHLKHMGYVSSIGEDVADSPKTAGKIYGYRNLNLTYDVYPHFHRVLDWVGRKLGNTFEYDPDKCPCVGNKFMSTHIFEFARSFVRQYHDVPKFLMTVHDESHDSRGNQVLMLDPDLKGYLKWLHKSKRLQHTAVLLMADHGLHYGPLFKVNETQAQREHNRPFAALILPRYAATDQLKKNAKRLVNIRDFHMTIRDLASFPQRSTETNVSPIAKSLLFDNIGDSRTCEEMKVGHAYRLSCTS